MHMSAPVENEISTSRFCKLTTLLFEENIDLLEHFWERKYSDGFETLLDMLPSLQRILLPPGRFLSELSETPIDRLARHLLVRPACCPALRDVGCLEYPTKWAAFLQMLTSRWLHSLLPAAPPLTPIHTLRFRRLPHAHIVQQLEDAMSGRRLIPHPCLPSCDPLCIHSRGIRDPQIQSYPINKVCFMCHSGRLEKGCIKGEWSTGGYYCLRWEDCIQADSWEIISV